MLLLALSVGLNSARCQTEVELLLEQSPARGGTMTPGSGIHTYATYSQISLTAVAREGYRFAYWLGDVSDPQSSTTQVHLDHRGGTVSVYGPLGGENN